MDQCDFNNMIKFGYRVNLQNAIDKFYNWTRYYQLIIGHAKCSTVTFCRKRFFRAYVYKLDGEKLDLIHSHQNGPQKCKHNEKLNYINPFDQDNESNGDSDLNNLFSNGNKIINEFDNNQNDIKDDIFRIKKSGKDKKRQMWSKHKLPLSVRILGVYFDPEMYFNEHILTIIGKTEKKLYGLTKLAYCKYYNFKPFVIFKLFESAIRPKLEYAICTTTGSTKHELLFKIQKRAMRISTQARMNTPTSYIQEILNFVTIEDKLKEFQIKLWHKSKRAPNNYLQRQTFDCWKKYIVENDENALDEFGNIKMDYVKFNYIVKSPLSNAYKTVKNLYPEYRNIFEEKPQSVMKPQPVYDTIYPNNMAINSESQNPTVDNYEKNTFEWTDAIDFYTDGSCSPNP